MGFQCGIIGLPNVGKSTLFNALTRTSLAQSANYPFCTIEPNIGEVDVPDERLNILSDINKSLQILPARLTFVDIAGLVKGASQGEGLGNQFLSNIREVDAVAHVVRCFEDENITHVNGQINPIDDIEIIETELLLSDIDSLDEDNLLPPKAYKCLPHFVNRRATITKILTTIQITITGGIGRPTVFPPIDAKFAIHSGTTPKTVPAEKVPIETNI